MFANELFESPNKIVVVYAGRFQPFHKGHRQVYEYLVKKFGRDSVYISTSNKVELPKSPFSFTDKSYFMQLQGIPMDRVVESKVPYRSEELMTQFDPNTTNLIVAVSEKDKSRFGQLGFKRDGSLSYFQEMPNKIQKMEPFANHGYVLVVPTFDFTVMGKPMRSATEVRAQYMSADDDIRKKIIKDLFGKYTAEAQQIMDSKLLSEDVAADSSSTAPVLRGINNESRGHKIIARKLSDIEARKKREQETAKRAAEKEKSNLIRRPAAGSKDQEQVDEMGGVGVVANKRQAKDPRYSMSLTKDVRPGAIKKSLRALRLAEKDMAEGADEIGKKMIELNRLYVQAKKLNDTTLMSRIKEKLSQLAQTRLQQDVAEEWSDKYKRSINCNNPKGFSQRAHCQGRKKNESVEINEMKCPHCGGPVEQDLVLAEKKDACYHKVRSRYKVWPSAYASGALVQCRKKGAKNWGKKS